MLNKDMVFIKIKLVWEFKNFNIFNIGGLNNFFFWFENNKNILDNIFVLYFFNINLIFILDSYI